MEWDPLALMIALADLLEPLALIGTALAGLLKTLALTWAMMKELVDLWGPSAALLSGGADLVSGQKEAILAGMVTVVTTAPTMMVAMIDANPTMSITIVIICSSCQVRLT